MKDFINKFKEKLNEGNLAAKILSLLLSIILWAYLASSKSGEIRFRIPVVINNLPSDMVIVDISSKSVIAVLEGKNDYLKNVNVKNIKAFVNLEKPVVNKMQKYPIKIRKNEIPVSINITLKQKNIKILVERKIAKRFRVIPDITGEVKEGSLLGDIIVEPAYVTIEGAQSAVEKIDKVFTEKISIDGRSGDIIKEVEIQKDDLEDVVLNPGKVKIIIPVIDYGNLYTIEVPVSVINQDIKYKYSIKNEIVKVHYKTEDNEKLSIDDFEANIDLKRINIKAKMARSKRNKITLSFPINVKLKNRKKGVDIISIIPEKILVNIIKE